MTELKESKVTKIAKSSNAPHRARPAAGLSAAHSQVWVVTDGARADAITNILLGYLFPPVYREPVHRFTGTPNRRFGTGASRFRSQRPSSASATEALLIVHARGHLLYV